VERGKTHRKNRRTIEHFGFVDGISQPRFFVGENDVSDKNIVLESDQLAGTPGAMGSYLVYRKLEQNVKAFRAAEDKLAAALGVGREQAGARIVGRFRDGSPLTKKDEPGLTPPDDNNFDYAGQHDADGSRCPFHAHIRKVRPRPDQRERMVRRGVPYGAYDPADEGMEYPEAGSGLLFLSFQRNIQSQFGGIQTEWANNAHFPKDFVGMDPLIGQGWNPLGQAWPVKWGDPTKGTIQQELGKLVTMKGGEFFFAPSLPFFEKLAGN
jgi:Dyp-type peroxidase family